MTTAATNGLCFEGLLSHSAGGTLWASGQPIARWPLPCFCLCCYPGLCWLSPIVQRRGIPTLDQPECLKKSCALPMAFLHIMAWAAESTKRCCEWMCRPKATLTTSQGLTFVCKLLSCDAGQAGAHRGKDDVEHMSCVMDFLFIKICQLSHSVLQQRSPSLEPSRFTQDEMLNIIKEGVEHVVLCDLLQRCADLS